MIHSLQLLHRAEWSKSSLFMRRVCVAWVALLLPLPLPDPAPLPGVPLPLVWDCDRAGLRCVGAYTVSLSGELDRSEPGGWAWATEALSCRNQRSRARREAASTSALASGTGIWCQLMSGNWSSL